MTCNHPELAREMKQVFCHAGEAEIFVKMVGVVGVGRLVSMQWRRNHA